MKLLFKVILVVCSLVGHAYATPGYDIIVVFGQSNSVGAGNGVFTYPAPDDERIYQLGRFEPNNLQPIRLTNEALQHWPTQVPRVGFGLTFARLYARYVLAPDRKVLVIAAGRGATSIKFWIPGQAGYLDVVTRLNTALAFPGSNKIVAMLWQQGEANTGVNGMTSSQYKTYLALVFDTLRASYGDFALLIGRLSVGWVQPHRLDVENGQIKFVRERPTWVRLISAAGLTTNNGDPRHFSASAQIKLAERYFQKYFLYYLDYNYGPQNPA